MKPSEQLKRTNLAELELQLEDALDDTVDYFNKYIKSKKESEKVALEIKEMNKAIKELESKGL